MKGIDNFYKCYITYVWQNRYNTKHIETCGVCNKLKFKNCRCSYCESHNKQKYFKKYCYSA